jgi:hypothetical protein
MAGKDYEVRQLLRAYRSGVISEEFLSQQVDELCAAGNGNGAAAMSAERSARPQAVTAMPASTRPARSRS